MNVVCWGTAAQLEGTEEGTIVQNNGREVNKKFQNQSKRIQILF